MTQPANKRLVTEAALTTYAAAKWQPTHAYFANDLVLAPDGTIIQRNANGTSRGSYDATEQALWTVKISGGGGGAVASVAGKTGVVTLAKGDVGLGNVDNTPDASKPVSTAQAAAISAAVSGLVNGAPGALDTLNELSAALGNDASFATTVTNALATKVNSSTYTAGLAGKADIDAAGQVPRSALQYAPIVPPDAFGPGRRAWTKVANFALPGHGWVTSGTQGAGANVNDTTNPLFPGQSAKVVTAGAGASAHFLKATIGSTFDLTGKVVCLLLSCADITHMNRLSLYAFAAGGTQSNSYNWVVQSTPLGGSQSANFITSGDLVLVKLSMHDAATSGTPPALNAIGGMQLTLTDINDGSLVTMNYGGIWLAPDAGSFA